MCFHSAFIFIFIRNLNECCGASCLTGSAQEGRGLPRLSRNEGTSFLRSWPKEFSILLRYFVRTSSCSECPSARFHGFMVVYPNDVFAVVKVYLLARLHMVFL